METLEYKVKINGDDSGLRKAIEGSSAKLQKLNENDYLIKLEYDGNAEGLKKIIQKINKQVPELGIKFQYDLNKKAFEAEKAKLDKMEFQVSISGNAEALAEETKKSFETLKKELANSGYSLEQVVNNPKLAEELLNAKQLRPFIDDFLQYSNALEGITKKLDKQFEELAYSFDVLPDNLPTENALKKQRENVASFEKELQNLSKEWEKTGLPKEALEMPKEISVSITADTEQFDSEILRIKQELDNLPDKKIIQVELDDGKDKLRNNISEWAEEAAINGFGNERYTIANSQNGYVANSYGTGDEGGVSGKAISRLSKNSKESIDTWIHSHPENYAAFSENDIRSAFAAVKNGINKQIVSSLNEVMRLDVDKVEPTKYDNIIADIEQKYKDVDSEIAAKFIDNLDDNIKRLKEAFISSLSGQSSSNSRNLFAFFSDEESIGDLSEAIRNSGSIQQIGQACTNYAENIVQNYVDVLKSQPLPSEEIEKIDVSSIFQKTLPSVLEDEAQKQYQEVLKQVFSDKKNLKAGVKDALTVSSIADFSFAKDASKDNAPKQEVEATVSLEPENVSEFRDKIQKGLDALPPIQVNAEPTIKKPEQESVLASPISASVEVAVGNAEDFADKIKQAVNAISPISVEIAPQISDTKLNEVVEAIKQKVEKAAVSAQSNAVANQVTKAAQSQINAATNQPATTPVQNKTASKKKKKTRPASWSIMAQAEQENEAFDKLKAAFGKSPTLDNGSFVKQWKIYQKEIEKVQAEAIKENEAFDKLTAIQSNHVEPIFNNKTSYVEQLKAYEKEQLAQLKDVNKMMGQLERGATNQNRPAKYLEKLRGIKEQVEKLNNDPLDLTDAGDVRRLEEAQLTLQKMVMEESKLKENRSGNSVKLASLLEQLTNTRYRYSGMDKDLDNAYVSRIEEVQGLLNNPGSTTAKNVEEITLKVKALDAQLAASGTKTKSFFDTVSERLTGANAQFIAQYLSIQDFIRYAHSAIDTVVSLDSAITELRKVSDASDFRLDESFKSAAETGKELGSTIKDIINLTADWSRLGYSVDEAEKLARITALFKNVGDGISTDEASSYMISTLKGFQLETDYAQRMVDVYNELGNNFAISSGEVGEALQRSAASLNAAKTSFEQSAALVTATNEIVQDADSVGNMWKTNITVFKYRNVLIRKYLIAGKA